MTIGEAGAAVGAGEVLGVLEAVGAGLLQREHVLRGQQAGAGGPEREHEGQAGQGLPQVAEVVDLRAGEAEGRVADDQRGVATAGPDPALAVRCDHEFGIDAAGGEEQPDQQGGAAGGGVEVDAGDLLERGLGDEDDRLDRSAAADPDLGHDLPLGVGRVGGDGDERHVAQALLEAPRALGGQGRADLEERLARGVDGESGAGQVLARQRVDERPGVEERDGADAERLGHGGGL